MSDNRYFINKMFKLVKKKTVSFFDSEKNNEKDICLASNMCFEQLEPRILLSGTIFSVESEIEDGFRYIADDLMPDFYNTYTALVEDDADQVLFKVGGQEYMDIDFSDGWSADFDMSNCTTTDSISVSSFSNGVLLDTYEGDTDILLLPEWFDSEDIQINNINADRESGYTFDMYVEVFNSGISTPDDWVWDIEVWDTTIFTFDMLQDKFTGVTGGYNFDIISDINGDVSTCNFSTEVDLKVLDYSVWSYEQLFYGGEYIKGGVDGTVVTEDTLIHCDIDIGDDQNTMNIDVIDYETELFDFSVDYDLSWDFSFSPYISSDLIFTGDAIAEVGLSGEINSEFKFPGVPLLTTVGIPSPLADLQLSPFLTAGVNLDLGASVLFGNSGVSIETVHINPGVSIGAGLALDGSVLGGMAEAGLSLEATVAQNLEFDYASSTGWSSSALGSLSLSSEVTWDTWFTSPGGAELFDITLAEWDFLEGSSTPISDVATINKNSSVDPEFSSLGTESNPWQISSVDDLQAINDDPEMWDDYFVLTNDISAGATRRWNMGDHDNDSSTPDEYMGFVPLGYNGSTMQQFSGHIDGNGYEITDLYINRAGSNSVGMIGYLSSGSVENIGFRNNQSGDAVVGMNNVGIVVGTALNSTIDSCFVTGDVSGANNVGGLVGNLSGSTVVSNSYSTGDISGLANNIGGLVGLVASGAKVEKSYATGNVSGASSLGGLVGSNVGYVVASYAVGKVTSGSQKGGLVGNNSGAVSGSAWNSSSSNGMSDGVGNNTGSFLSSTGVADNNFNSVYSGWSDSIWRNTTMNGIEPKHQFTPEFLNFSTPTDSDNDGLIDIADYGDLYWLSQNRNGWDKDYELTADINASSSHSFYFSPIGTSSSTGYEFTGSLYGNGYKISNLYINSSYDYVGLFGYFKGEGIYDLGLEDIYVSGSENIGSLAGYMVSGVVNNCYATGDVIDHDSNNSGSVGGLIGSFSNSSIIVKESYADVRVINDYGYTGGLIGQAGNGIVSGCYAAGDVVSYSERTGGLIGYNYSRVVNCYATGDVESSSYYVGGLIGMNNDRVMFSYATGNVKGSSSVGGFVGYNTGSLQYCFSTGKATGASSIGGFVGNNGSSGSSGDIIYNCAWNNSSSSGNADGVGTTDESHIHNLNGIANNNYKSVYSNWNSEFWSGLGSNSLPRLKDWDSSIIDISAAPVDSDNDGLIEIGNFSDLYWLSQNSNGWGNDYELTADINASASYGVYFSPIGTSSSTGYEFTGSFYGNGYKISNLYINSSYDYVGLFGYFKGEGIYDLGLEDIYVLGSENIGSLAGYMVSGVVNNCYATGDVIDHDSNNSGSVGGLIGSFSNSSIIVKESYADVRVINDYGYTGGLIGQAGNGIVSGCYAAGDVVSYSERTGGLIGYNYSRVVNCYATGDVESSSYYVGGLIGMNNDRVMFSYATGNVKGSSSVGGFVGYNTGSLQYCFSTGKATGASSIGGFVGNNGSSGSSGDIIYNCAWNNSSSSGNADGVGTTDESHIHNLNGIANNNYKSVYSNWNSEFWSGLGSNSLPRLKDWDSSIIDISAAPVDSDNDGLIEIGNFSDLYWLSQNSNGWGNDYELTADINASASYGVYFSPIGTSSSTGYEFTGSFYGNGYKISNLYINSSYDYVGLFGYFKGEGIYDLGLEDIYVLGSENIGSLAGYMVSGVVNNCYATGDVIDHDSNNSGSVGGLIGSFSNSSIIVKESYADVRVINDYGYTGGLIGQAGNGIVSGCYAAGDVVSYSERTGGLIGYNYSRVVNCYATGDVIGTFSVGGLIGLNSGDVAFTYAAGDASGSSESNTNVGGLVGYNSSGSIEYSFASGKAAGNDRIGGIAGYFDGIMTGCLATGIVAGGTNFGALIGYKDNGSDISGNTFNPNQNGLTRVYGNVDDNNSLFGNYSDTDADNYDQVLGWSENDWKNLGNELNPIHNFGPTLTGSFENITINNGSSFITNANEVSFSVRENQEIDRYEITLADGSAAPEWLKFDEGQMSFFGFADNAGEYNIKLTAYDTKVDADYASAYFKLTVSSYVALSSSVAGGFVYYSNMDGAADDPRSAVAVNKHAYTGVGDLSESIISSTNGITGVIVDIKGDGNYTLADFDIKVGTGGDVTGWQSYEAAGIGVPTITVKSGEGVGGSDRVLLTWDSSNAPKNTWLQVTAKTSAGISHNSSQIFGSIAGDIDESGSVNINDIITLLPMCNRILSNLTISNYDTNNSGSVNINDIISLLPLVNRPVALTAPDLSGMSMTQDGLFTELESAENLADDLNQIVYIDVDGERGFIFNSPIALSGITTDAFSLSGQFSGQEDSMLERVLDNLNSSDYALHGVEFTFDRPLSGDYSTIFVGGDDDTFEIFGDLYGISENVDTDNLVKNDNAIVFSDELGLEQYNDLDTASSVLTEVIEHEVGHLLGLKHA